jgi:hypothetical protein
MESDDPKNRLSGASTAPVLSKLLTPEYLATVDEAGEQMKMAVMAGAPPILLVDDPLPDGVVAIVRNVSLEKLDCFVVVSVIGLEDRRLMDAVGSVYSHRVAVLARRRTQGPVTITWYADGRFTMEMAGQPVETHEVIRKGALPEGHLFADEVLRLAEGLDRIDVPGVGIGRVVRIPDP